MSTRPITSDDAALAAELVRLVRERPNDRVDPFPPSHEMEVLADSGARGKGPESHAIVAVVDDGVKELVVGYGAQDFSPNLRHAQLVGPVVHPAHRRQGHGSRLMQALLEQARRAHQKYARIMVSNHNGAAKALLGSTGFRQKKVYTCLGLEKPKLVPEIEMDGITVRQVSYADADDVSGFTQKLVPRQAKQVRSLLKSDDYVILLAYRGERVVGFAELDMRFGDTATVEQIDGVPSLLERGLGNLLLASLIPVAFHHEGVRCIELLTAGTDRKRLEAYAAAGFEARGEFLGFEKQL